MCGRFTLRTPAAEVARQFELFAVPELAPRYNIAPTQDVAVVRTTTAGRALDRLRWGLVPSWADDPSIGARMINARSETAAEKPSFRRALLSRRCLIPADGFCEWQAAGRGKQPYLITLGEGDLFALAGLWERWTRDGTALETCTILTTTANTRLAALHDRMPVIVPREAYARWLDPDVDDPAALGPLLVPYPPEAFQLRPVSSYVNSAKNEGPRCLEPVAEPGTLGGLADGA